MSFAPLDYCCSLLSVIASGAKQSIPPLAASWICFAPLSMTTVGSCAPDSHPIENDHGRRARQRLSRNFQGALGALVDDELLADQAHEFVERGSEAVHRQHHAGTQPLGD